MSARHLRYLCFVLLGLAMTNFAAEEQGEEEDSAAGLPPEYASSYLIARSTISLDKKLAIIYPTLDAEEAADKNNRAIKNYVVALEPFAVLGTLETKWPYFQNESHGGLEAEWSADNSVALITLDGKWGPHDVFLLEFRDSKLKRSTNVLRKAHELLLPDYRKAKVGRYNDYFDFIFDGEDGAVCQLDGTTQVRIDADATTDPKGLSHRKWQPHLKAVWDIARARFTEQKITH